MEIIKLREEFIKLGQALKAAGLVESGVEAKEVIQEGLVTVSYTHLPLTEHDMHPEALSCDEYLLYRFHH